MNKNSPWRSDDLQKTLGILLISVRETSIAPLPALISGYERTCKELRTKLVIKLSGLVGGL